MASMYVLYYALLFQLTLHFLCLNVNCFSCFESSNSLNCDYTDLPIKSTNYNSFLSDSKGQRVKMSQKGLQNLELPLELSFFGIDDVNEEEVSSIDDQPFEEQTAKHDFTQMEAVKDFQSDVKDFNNFKNNDFERKKNSDIEENPNMKEKSAAAFDKLTLILTNILATMQNGINEFNISVDFLRRFDIRIKDLHYNVRMIAMVLRVGIPFMDRLVSSSYIQNSICLKLAGKKTSILMILQEQLSIFKKANALFGYLGMSNAVYQELKTDHEHFTKLFEDVKLEMKVIDFFSGCIKQKWENLDRKIELLRLKYESIISRKNLLDTNMQIYHEFSAYSTRIVQIGRYVYHKLKSYKALKVYFNLWPSYLKKKPSTKYMVNLSVS